MKKGPWVSLGFSWVSFGFPLGFPWFFFGFSWLTALEIQIPSKETGRNWAAFHFRSYEVPFSEGSWIPRVGGVCFCLIIRLRHFFHIFSSFGFTCGGLVVLVVVVGFAMFCPY